MSSKPQKIKQLKPFNPEGLPLPSLQVQEALASFLENKGEHSALDLEIGCGVGLHPVQYSLKNPERFLIAAEHTLEKFQKFERRYRAHPDLKNLLPLHANAISVAHHLLTDQTLDRCFLLYPNPNPKKLNQRWHAMPFMQRLINLLKPQGELIMATNESFYAQEAMLWMQDYWGLEAEMTPMTQSSHPAHEGRTHFERKYLLRGEICYHLSFKKKVSGVVYE